MAFRKGLRNKAVFKKVFTLDLSISGALQAVLLSPGSKKVQMGLKSLAKREAERKRHTQSCATKCNAGADSQSPRDASVLCRRKQMKI